MLHTAIHWLIDVISSLGYGGIFLLMAMESSLLPVPSELVMPPAGYLIHTGEMHWFGVIALGTLGSLAGAYVNYFAARYLGRPFILRFGKYFLISEAKLCTAENFFIRHGAISTFIGRLLPVVRHLISIPAGITGMRHSVFALYTTLGAFLWCSVLTIIGFIIGKNEELVLQWTHRAIGWLIAGCIILTACYIAVQRQKKEPCVDSEPKKEV
jgi:membrane protein DedA with SNARE-associated domain